MMKTALHSLENGPFKSEGGEPMANLLALGLWYYILLIVLLIVLIAALIVLRRRGM